MNQTLRLLGRATSINVRKVLWTLDEAGLAYRHEAWGEGELSLRSPEFLALNPLGMIPVLVDGDAVLRESNTLCRYVAARAGRQDLLPTEALARARVEQWMDWQATELNNAWRYAFMGLVRKSPAHQDAVLLAQGLQGWNAQMDVLEAQLQTTGAYAAGDAFTLADVVLGLSLERWRQTPQAARPSFPALEAYHARLCERPAFRRHGANGQP
ncbi:glutathione S-transferase N-terminal domain-containing protein [Pelomonas sp. APW6]|uniref:Glutathione S-transferase N-terminal domain-containing protein n=1 Tax=Roseateles subflavus TaxID=3053353 RepID=A0ABT7LK92_9BURK|nr:glutathione S-transferase N-terminal domain-containing protein [Pelomonas sp. APW6]MDL5033292.1 glutathione S-transferase N-terminal domain-containing protein [Pelomonas sp. APW6]